MINLLTAESVIIAALETQAEFKTVDRFQGDFKDLLRDPRKLPAALLVYDGTTTTSRKAGDRAIKARLEVSYTVFLLVKNLKSDKDVSNDARELLKKSRDVLNGKAVGKQIILKFKDESLQFLKNGVCVYAQAFDYEDYLSTSIT
jgi:hypothetical protein